MDRAGRFVALVAMGIALLGGPVVAQERGGANPLVGAWMLQAYDLEFQDTKERRPALGPHPRGSVVFTPEGRMTVYLEDADRKAPTTDAERAAAFKGLLAYTGTYRLEGNRWVTSVDGAWNVTWTGTDQVREFVIDGSRLTVVAQWNPNPLYANRQTRGRLVFTRMK